MQEIHTANNGSKFTILCEERVKVGKKHWNKVLVKFLETGSTRWCYKENVVAGKVKDLYSKTKYGIGYLGEVKSQPPYYKQAYQLWSNMFKRCYSEFDEKGYKKWGAEVCPRWHCFATFLEDLPLLENFDKWLKGVNRGQIKYCLDKDYKVPSNSVYSKELCMFLDEHTNKSEGAKSTLKEYYRSGHTKVDGRELTPRA